MAFDAVGGLDEGIDVNKDTKLSVRLAASEHRCYCDHTPGFILIRDPERSAYDQSSITDATGARARYRAFEYILLQHQEFLKNHGAFRGKMFPRVIKYHVCAASLADWFWFCAHYWPVSDVVLYIVPGTLWLGLACQNSYRANPSNLRGKASMLFHVNSRPRLGRSRRD